LPEARGASFQAELVRLGARFFIKHGTRPGVGIEVRRRRMKAYERWVPRPPAGVVTVARPLGGVPASRITAPQSAGGRHILFLHGGAYMTGSALLYRLKNHILTHLADPELSLPRAAAATGISPRYASDLMAAEQTSFRGYVQTQRLERCKRDLADPAYQARHIGEIAFAWGFNDLAHFSRIFKQRFGVSPREWREQPRQ